jgi:elongation factor 1-gamma
MSPLKKLPILETSEGTISEVNAAVRYVARIGSSALYNGSPSELAQIDNWLDVISNELESNLSQWVFTALGQVPHVPTAVAQAQAEVKKVIFILEQRLKLHPYITGDKLTLVDVVAANTLALGFKLLFDEKYRKPLGNLTRWFSALAASEEFRAVWGPIKLAKVALPLPEAKVAAVEETKQAPKKEEVKVVQPPLDDEPKKKGPNPLDLLPESRLVMDEWKKLYANTVDKASTLPWFWEHYDPEGYSIWIFKYNKTEGECQVLYRTNNLLNGFLQRMEEFRKYSFGYLGIYGAEPVLDIAGCFMWRGTEIAEEMKEHPQIESFIVTKVDVNDPAQRSLVDDYWGKTEEDNLVEGKPVVDGKYWK